MAIILIADEEGLFVALETTPVLRTGCRLIPVRSCRELLNLASTHIPDLILLDADMMEPGLVPALRSLRSDRRLMKVPIVLAAKEPGRLKGEVGEAGMVYGKPVAPEDIGAALKFLLPVPRRVSPRVALSVPVSCRINGRTVVLKTKDVGAGGLFLKTHRHIACGTRFEASFQIPAGRSPARSAPEISAVCEVVRRVGPEEADLIAGVGAAFVSIEMEDESLLKRFVSAAPS